MPSPQGSAPRALIPVPFTKTVSGCCGPREEEQTGLLPAGLQIDSKTQPLHECQGLWSVIADPQMLGNALELGDL